MTTDENENKKTDLSENQKMICQVISTFLIVVGKIVLAVVIVLGAAMWGAASIAISLGGSKNN